MTENSLKDEKGNIRLSSPQLNVTFALITAGENTDPDTGRHYKWDESCKIIIGNDRAIKLTALQLAYIRDALKVPEVDVELQARIEKEKAAFLATVGAF